MQGEYVIMKKGFDANKYIEEQSKYILERIKKSNSQRETLFQFGQHGKAMWRRHLRRDFQRKYLICNWVCSPIRGTWLEPALSRWFLPYSVASSDSGFWNAIFKKPGSWSNGGNNKQRKNNSPCQYFYIADTVHLCLYRSLFLQKYVAAYCLYDCVVFGDGDIRMLKNGIKVFNLFSHQLRMAHFQCAIWDQYTLSNALYLSDWVDSRFYGGLPAFTGTVWQTHNSASATAVAILYKVDDIEDRKSVV